VRVVGQQSYGAALYYFTGSKDAEVLVSIDSDAHSIHDFNNLRFGVDQARRGWLEKADILNSRPLCRLRPLLARTIEVNP
jgi:DNA polymerase (family X)